MSVRILLIVLLIILGSSFVFATPQRPDILIYEGKEYPIYNGDLLRDYFIKFPERNPMDKVHWCSDLWRGYSSVFEVSDGRIYLKDIFTGDCVTRISQLKKVVPDGKPLAMDEYSGVLLAFYRQQDDVDNPYSLDFYDAFEKYSIFEVTKGTIDEVRHFDKKAWLEFRKRQVQSFKKTPEYEVEFKRRTAQTRGDNASVDADIEFFVLWEAKKLFVK